MRPFHPLLWVDRLFLNKIPERAQKTRSWGKEMKHHTPKLLSQNRSTDRWHYTHAGDAAALLFTLFLTLTHKNVSAGQRGLPECLSPFLLVLLTSFDSYQLFPFSSHIHTPSKTDFLSTLSYNTVWQKKQFKNFVHHKILLSITAISSAKMLFSACIDCDRSSSFAPLFHILIGNRCANVCIYHLSVSSSALGCWAYRRVLAHLNTFVSHANVTESRAVALVAMQPLN